MALTKTFLKKTHQDVVVKIQGSTGSETVSLATDLLPAAGQIVKVGGTPKVTINGVTWTGAAASVITITRNSVPVMTLTGGSAGFHVAFDGQAMPPENTESTSDLVVSISGGQAEVWLRLHKVEGYQTTVEPEQFGPYDDPTVAGS